MKSLDGISLLVAVALGAFGLWALDYFVFETLGTTKAIAVGGLLGAWVQIGERVSGAS